MKELYLKITLEPFFLQEADRVVKKSTIQSATAAWRRITTSNITTVSFPIVSQLFPAVPAPPVCAFIRVAFSTAYIGAVLAMFADSHINPCNTLHSNRSILKKILSIKRKIIISLQMVVDRDRVRSTVLTNRRSSFPRRLRRRFNRCPSRRWRKPYCPRIWGDGSRTSWRSTSPIWATSRTAAKRSKRWYRRLYTRN